MSVAMLALRDLVLWDYRVAADIEQQRGSTVVARPFLTGRAGSPDYHRKVFLRQVERRSPPSGGFARFL